MFLAVVGSINSFLDLLFVYNLHGKKRVSANLNHGEILNDLGLGY